MISAFDGTGLLRSRLTCPAASTSPIQVWFLTGMSAASAHLGAVAEVTWSFSASTKEVTLSVTTIAAVEIRFILQPLRLSDDHY
jgi:hypothetical protein